MAEEQEGGTSQAVTPIPKTKFSHTEQFFWNNGVRRNSME